MTHPMYDRDEHDLRAYEYTSRGNEDYVIQPLEGGGSVIFDADAYHAPPAPKPTRKAPRPTVYTVPAGAD